MMFVRMHKSFLENYKAFVPSLAYVEGATANFDLFWWFVEGCLSRKHVMVNSTNINFQAVFEVYKSLKKQELLNRVVEVCLDSSD